MKSSIWKNKRKQEFNKYSARALENLGRRTSIKFGFDLVSGRVNACLGLKGWN